MRFQLLLPLLALAGMTGCDRSTPVTEVALDPRPLCVAIDDVTSTLPDGMAAAVAHAAAQPQAAMRWIAVGRGWEELAHRTGDAGYFIHVDACADAASAAQPGIVQADELRAASRLNAHAFNEAATLADAILQRDPDNVIAYGVRSDALLELGRYRDAAAAAREQMHRWPGAAAQARGAYLRWLHGDVEGAKQALVAALRGRDARTPSFNAWLSTETARLYWHEGDTAGADQLFELALVQWPQHAPALLGRAQVALLQGNAGRALLFARRAQAAAASFDAAVLIGDAHAALGDRGAADAAYRDAEQLGLRGDRLGLARFLAERARDPQRALALATAEARSRGGVHVDDVIAWSRYRLGDCAAARAASDAALRLGTRDARLWYHGAAIDFACGESARGRERLEMALRLNPRFDPFAANELHALAARHRRSPT